IRARRPPAAARVPNEAGRGGVQSSGGARTVDRAMATRILGAGRGVVWLGPCPRRVGAWPAFLAFGSYHDELLRTSQRMELHYCLKADKEDPQVEVLFAVKSNTHNDSPFNSFN
ncbi:unnamed protein product, partial [Urochloa humidicola]